MAQFPENLPPEGLELFPKLLIYFGILYVLTTALTTWLVTRRRSFPKPEIIETPAPQTTEQVIQTSAGVTETMSFDDTKDKLSSLKVEVQGAEAALTKLNELKGELSTEAFQKLNKEYQSRVAELSKQMNEMLKSDIQSSSGAIEAGVTDDEMDAIEADLEQQLMELDNDDFLVSRPKRDMNEIFQEEKPSPQAAPPAARPPSSTQPKKVPMPPPPKKAAAPPPPTSSTQPASSQQVSAPPQPGQETKRVPMPPPPKKAAAPPPPTSSRATAPAAAVPAAKPPATNQRLSAAQPMKVQTEDDDGMFAKSTSIAALRMDMLRELARLKKLIPEDEDKNQ